MVTAETARFVPPSCLFGEHPEKRKLTNFFRSIVEIGDPETVEIGLVPFMLCAGMVLSCFHAGDLGQCGAAVVLAALIGLVGLIRRLMLIKMMFGVIGAAAQAYGCLYVVQRSPGEVTWVALGAGALACFWIFSRASRAYFRGQRGV